MIETRSTAARKEAIAEVAAVANTTATTTATESIDLCTSEDEVVDSPFSDPVHEISSSETEFNPVAEASVLPTSSSSSLFEEEVGEQLGSGFEMEPQFPEFDDIEHEYHVIYPQCQYNQCESHGIRSNENYVRLECSNGCKMDYHTHCWGALQRDGGFDVTDGSKLWNCANCNGVLVCYNNPDLSNGEDRKLINETGVVLINLDQDGHLKSDTYIYIPPRCRFLHLNIPGVLMLDVHVVKWTFGSSMNGNHWLNLGLLIILRQKSILN
jgi:hypothetical protein